MHRLASILVEPLLRALEPRVIVETGAGRGRLTRILLERAPDAVVHAIDPDPRLNATALGRAHPGRLFVHPTTSAVAIPAIADVDLAVLDGDPNHATVLGDLRALTAGAGPPPVVLVRHTGWPFARRDGYYAPDRLPPDALNDPRPAGVRPGHGDVADDGVRPVPFAAARDSGAENGVRRALDAFVGDHADWSQADVPGLHGVGVLCPPDRLVARPALGPFLAGLSDPPFLLELVRVVERARVAGLPAEDAVAPPVTPADLA